MSLPAPPLRLLIATSNEHKLRELRRLLPHQELLGRLVPDNRLALVDCETRKVMRIVGNRVPPSLLSQKLGPEWRFANAGFHRYLRATCNLRVWT